MTHPRHYVLLSVILLLMWPLSAAAIEVLLLDGGSITAFTPGFADVNITGPRTAIGGLQQIVLGPDVYGFTACGLGTGSCSPGTLLQVGGSGAGGDFYGGVILDGVSHALGNNPGFDGLSLSVSASVLIPEFGSIESVILAAPFVLTGTLFRSGGDCGPHAPPGCSGDPFSMTAYPLQGLGIFHLEMHRASGGSGDFWRWDSAEFALQPTPEPTALLLWGTSAAGLGLVRWRRRRAHTTTKADSA